MKRRSDPKKSSSTRAAPEAKASEGAKRGQKRKEQRMSTPRRPQNGPEGALGQQGNNLDQVRELLFGPHYREIERSLSRIEGHLSAHADEERLETRRLIEVIEGHLREEIDSLAARLAKERASQAEALGSAAKENRDAIAALEGRLTRLEETLSRAQRDMRQQLLERSRSFLEEVHRVRVEVVAMLDREFALYRGELPASASASSYAEEPEEVQASPEP